MDAARSSQDRAKHSAPALTLTMVMVMATVTAMIVVLALAALSAMAKSADDGLLVPAAQGLHFKSAPARNVPMISPPIISPPITSPSTSLQPLTASYHLLSGSLIPPMGSCMAFTGVRPPFCPQIGPVPYPFVPLPFMPLPPPLPPQPDPLAAALPGILGSMASMGGGGPAGNRGGLGGGDNGGLNASRSYSSPSGTNYPSSGGNPGDYREGMCTTEAQAKNKRQWANQYCELMIKEIENPNSCAGKAFNQLMEVGGASGSGIRGFGEFCKPGDFSAMSLKDKKMAYVNLAAAIATGESNWNPNVGASDHGTSMGIFQMDNAGDVKSCAAEGLGSGDVRTPSYGVRCGQCNIMTQILHARALGNANDHAGLYAKWGEFHHANQDGKRRGMATAVREFCEAKAKSPSQDTGTTAVAAVQTAK